MLALIEESWLIAAIGLAGGVLLGLAARLGRFCTLGMIEDAHYGNDRARLWMWALALGVAILGNFTAEAVGLIRLGDTIYLRNDYSLIGVALGGLLFGYGMAHAGNCGYGMLARLGGGDLRAMVIAIVMGIAKPRGGKDDSAGFCEADEFFDGVDAERKELVFRTNTGLIGGKAY